MEIVFHRFIFILMNFWIIFIYKFYVFLGCIRNRNFPYYFNWMCIAMQMCKQCKYCKQFSCSGECWIPRNSLRIECRRSKTENAIEINRILVWIGIQFLICWQYLTCSRSTFIRYSIQNNTLPILVRALHTRMCVSTLFAKWLRDYNYEDCMYMLGVRWTKQASFPLRLH